MIAHIPYRQQQQRESDVKLLGTSIPGWKRPSYIPTVIVLSVSWVLTASLIVASLIGAVQNGPVSWVAAIVLTIGLIIAAFLAMFTRNVMREFDRSYILELTDSEIRLKVLESKAGRAWVVRMPWFEVSYVAHHAVCDRASLIFHGGGGRIIEVPIWAMTDNVDEILQFLEKKRIWIERA